jgi:hypothetical protein
MTTDDIRWLDENALHRALQLGLPDAFAEVIRRFDPQVRAQLSRATPDDLLEYELAEFWIRLFRDPRFRQWTPEIGPALAQHIAALAAKWCNTRLHAA